MSRTYRVSIVVILLLASSLTSKACDVCGCKLGGLYFGILPQYNNHFIGLRYSHADFNATMNYNSNYLENESSRDTYQKVELMGRVVINKKFQLNFILPYLFNEMDGSHQDIYSSGMGDPMVLAYYQLLNNAESFTSDWKHALLVGAGLKLPLGEYKAQDNGELINRNFQLGSGSLDYLISLNYTLRKNSIGVNVETGYKLNTENSDHYKFGNQFNANSYFFYWKEIKKFSLMPYSGIYFEQGASHKNHDFEEHNTGGHATFCSIGLQSYLGTWTLNALFQVPLDQKFNSDQISKIEAGNRFTVGLLFNIPKKSSKFLVGE